MGVPRDLFPVGITRESDAGEREGEIAQIGVDVVSELWTF